MTPARLLLYPDPGLRRVAAPVEAFGAALDPIVEAVLAIMRKAGAVGLTAAHCDVPIRLVVVAPPAEPVSVYANPRLLHASEAMQENEEGSVSMPGVRATIGRPARIRIAFQDRDGQPQEAERDGFDAAILLHEMDQLDGIFWLDRLSRLKRERLVKRFDKLARR